MYFDSPLHIPSVLIRQLSVVAIFFLSRRVSHALVSAMFFFYSYGRENVISCFFLLRRKNIILETFGIEAEAFSHKKKTFLRCLCQVRYLHP